MTTQQATTKSKKETLKGMTAFLKSYRQSPRKVRVVADHIRGMNVERALTELPFIAKRSSAILKKLIESAVANSGKNIKDLIIKTITVNEGPTMKRSLPRARGMATRINKRTSHVSVTLADTIESVPTKTKTVQKKQPSKLSKK